MVNNVYIYNIIQDVPVGPEGVPDLPTDGTGVTDQFPDKVPSDLDAVSESTKKSEVAEGKLKLIDVHDATTEALEETSSQENVPVPTATTPTEPAIDHKYLQDICWITLLIV